MSYEFPIKHRSLLKRLACSAIPAASLLFNVTIANAADKWQGYIEAEGKYSKQRSIGEGGLFIPLWQDDTDLVFTDLRGKFDDNDSQEFNLGLGYRTILNEDWIIGGYGFYDRRQSPTGNHYDQATFGAEAFTKHLDLRANIYIPESTENTLGAGGTVGAISGGQLQIQTMSGSSERALPGFDAEVGYKFDITDNWNLTTTVGGFYFDADGYEEVAGPRGRMELAYDDIPFLSEGSRFTIGFESQHDDVRGTQTFGLARLRIPFSQFIPGKTEKLAPLTALEKRMTTRIVRDVDIVAGQGGGGVASTEVAEVTTAGGANVSNATIISTGDDIATEVTNAGNNALIIINGAVTTNTTISMQSGQTLTGAGQTLTLTGTTSGDTVSYQLPGSTATITNTNNAVTTLRLAANSSISDLTITGGNTGINVNGANMVVDNVTISNTHFGMHLSGGNGAVSNLHVLNATGSGFYVSAGSHTLTDSIIDNSDTGLEAGGTLVASNIRISNPITTGIFVHDVFSPASLTLNSTTVEDIDTGVTGVFLWDNGGNGTPVLNGSGNTMTGTGGTACRIFMGSFTGSLAFDDILGGGAGTCP